MCLRSRPTSAASRTWSSTARAASSFPPATPGAWPSASRRSPPTRTCAARWARSAPTWVRSRYSVPRLVGDIDTLYRSLLARPTADAEAAHRAARARLLAGDAERIARAPRTLDVLLLSQYFPPEVGATQSRMQSFAEYLHERGHNVTVIAEFPNHPFGVVPARYRRHLVDDDRSNGYRVLRVWAKASEEKTQRTRLAFYLSYSALATAMAPLDRSGGRRVRDVAAALHRARRALRSRGSSARRSCSTCATCGRLRPRRSTRSPRQVRCGGAPSRPSASSIATRRQSWRSRGRSATTSIASASGRPRRR